MPRYESTDSCGKNTTVTTTTILGNKMSGDGGKQQLLCSYLSDKRNDWITEGCEVLSFVPSRTSSNTTGAATAATATCKCSIVLPPRKKQTPSFSADLSLIASFAFSRVAKPFKLGTNRASSPVPVLLLCGIPFAMFLILLVAYRFVPRLQRFGAKTKQERKELQKETYVLCVCVYVCVSELYYY